MSEYLPRGLSHTRTATLAERRDTCGSHSAPYRKAAHGIDGGDICRQEILNMDTGHKGRSIPLLECPAESESGASRALPAAQPGPGQPAVVPVAAAPRPRGSELRRSSTAPLRAPYVNAAAGLDLSKGFCSQSVRCGSILLLLTSYFRGENGREPVLPAGRGSGQPAKVPSFPPPGPARAKARGSPQSQELPSGPHAGRRGHSPRPRGSHAWEWGCPLESEAPALPLLCILGTLGVTYVPPLLHWVTPCPARRTPLPPSPRVVALSAPRPLLRATFPLQFFNYFLPEKKKKKSFCQAGHERSTGCCILQCFHIPLGSPCPLPTHCRCDLWYFSPHSAVEWKQVEHVHF